MTKALAVIKHYSTLPEHEIDNLLELCSEDILEHDTFVNHLSQLDQEVLKRALPEAREILGNVLPSVAGEISQKYGMKYNPMSSHTLGNWSLGFVQNMKQIPFLVSIHSDVPAGVYEDYLEQILTCLEELTAGREVWQDCVASLCIPLIAHSAREDGPRS